MMRLVRKLSDAGRTVDKSSSSLGSGVGLFRLKVLDREDVEGRVGGILPDGCTSPPSCSFFLDLKGFMLMNVVWG